MLTPSGIKTSDWGTTLHSANRACQWMMTNLETCPVAGIRIT